MSQRTTSRIPGTSQLRARAAVLALGLGVSAAVGAGVAVAADAKPSAVSLSSEAAVSVQKQAAAQAKAAQSKSKAAAEKAKAKKAAAKPAAAKTASSWVDPVKKYKLSASFAQAGNLWSSTHSGQDFAVSSGTQVVAAHGGTVVKTGGNGAGDGPAYGNAVVIKHSNGTYSQYAHLSRVDVKPGQVVKTGQRIALSGNTGNSSGPHLHFEIRTSANYGSAVDPVAFLRSKGLSL
ncbi:MULTISPECIES: M23 family metallopeptidase [Streptomyces]|uniref:M23 family metallopeptidase n=1 Tax=Streptomyces tauricus TaxID=68274 RepID=A0ABZ1JHK9_9ACTN|nr:MULTISPECIES: M23 family metallopeptidase [Streptomyces]MCW8103097.1 M23 family metallopeptidase [Streptomyces tauricus]UPZ30544.1 M23 family metallopeptidase [Streptomyces sp. LRE541]